MLRAHAAHRGSNLRTLEAIPAGIVRLLFAFLAFLIAAAIAYSVVSDVSNGTHPALDQLSSHARQLLGR